jgi:hypothetical protein
LKGSSNEGKGIDNSLPSKPLTILTFVTNLSSFFESDQFIHLAGKALLNLEGLI